MGFLDFLRKKRPVAGAEEMARLQSADREIKEAGLQFAEKAGICYRASNGCKDVIQGIVRYPQSSGITTRCSTVEDSYGCIWILLEGSLDRVMTSAGAVFDAVSANACGQDFLCAAFAYTAAERRVYWIYSSYGKFYPFAPVGEERDNELEINLKRELEEALPVERALSQWHPLWGLPL